MRKFVLLFLVLLVFPLLSSAQMNDTVERIKYIPKEFKDLKLGLDVDADTDLHPKHPDPINRAWEGILINIPQQINLYTVKDTSLLKIPVCTYGRFMYPKINELNLLTYNIQNIHEDKVYCGILNFREERYRRRDQNEIPSIADKPATQEAIEKYKNVVLTNVSNYDLLDFVQIPIKSGKYKIWIETAGYKSNEKILEIIIGE